MATPAVSPRASVHHSQFGAAVAARDRAMSQGGVSPRVQHDRPDVPTPEAKRPLDAAAIQVSIQGVRHMSTEDLSSAFFALNGRVERTEGHGKNLYECVDFNANLLTEVCKELAALKAAQEGTATQVGSTVLKLTSDTREAIDVVNQRADARDVTLREELNAMTKTLEKGHGLLEAKSDALRINIDEVVAQMSQAVAGPTAQGTQEPPAPPGLVNQQIEYLQTAVTSIAARLQMAESKSEIFESAITDVQAGQAGQAGPGRPVLAPFQ